MKAYRCKRCKGIRFVEWGQRKRCVVCDVKSNWHMPPIKFPPKPGLLLACEPMIDDHINDEATWIPPWVDELI